MICQGVSMYVCVCVCVVLSCPVFYQLLAVVWCLIINSENIKLKCNRLVWYVALSLGRAFLPCLFMWLILFLPKPKYLGRITFPQVETGSQCCYLMHV